MPSAPCPAAGHMISAGNDLLDQFRFAQALQSGRGENDGVVFALFEFAQARIDVAAQGMNIEIGTDRLELRLAAQAGRAHARALRQVLQSRIKLRSRRRRAGLGVP